MDFDLPEVSQFPNILLFNNQYQMKKNYMYACYFLEQKKKCVCKSKYLERVRVNGPGGSVAKIRHKKGPGTFFFRHKKGAGSRAPNLGTPATLTSYCCLSAEYATRGVQRPRAWRAAGRGAGVDHGSPIEHQGTIILRS